MMRINKRRQSSFWRFGLVSVFCLLTACASTGGAKPSNNTGAVLQKWHQAETEYKRGNYTGAQSAYEAVLQKHPSHADSLFRLGTIAYRHGDLAMAEDYFRRVLKKNSNHSRATYNLAMIYLNHAYDRLLQYLYLEPKGHRHKATQDLVRRMNVFNSGN